MLAKVLHCSIQKECLDGQLQQKQQQSSIQAMWKCSSNRQPPHSATWPHKFCDAKSSALLQCEPSKRLTMAERTSCQWPSAAFQNMHANMHLSCMFSSRNGRPDPALNPVRPSNTCPTPLLWQLRPQHGLCGWPRPCCSQRRCRHHLRCWQSPQPECRPVSSQGRACSACSALGQLYCLQATQAARSAAVHVLSLGLQKTGPCF